MTVTSYRVEGTKSLGLLPIGGRIWTGAGVYVLDTKGGGYTGTLLKGNGPANLSWDMYGKPKFVGGFAILATELYLPAGTVVELYNGVQYEVVDRSETQNVGDHHCFYGKLVSNHCEQRFIGWNKFGETPNPAFKITRVFNKEQQQMSKLQVGKVYQTTSGEPVTLVSDQGRCKVDGKPHRWIGYIGTDSTLSFFDDSGKSNRNPACDLVLIETAWIAIEPCGRIRAWAHKPAESCVPALAATVKVQYRAGQRDF